MIGFLQGPSGENSSLRAIMWFVFGLVGAVWAACSLFHFSPLPGGGVYWQPVMATIPDGVSNMLGYLLTAKVAQGGVVESGAIGVAIDMLKEKKGQQ